MAVVGSGGGGRRSMLAEARGRLPLLLRGADAGRVPLLDTTRIHVSKAVTALLA